MCKARQWLTAKNRRVISRDGVLLAEARPWSLAVPTDTPRRRGPKARPLGRHRLEPQFSLVRNIPPLGHHRSPVALTCPLATRRATRDDVEVRDRTPRWLRSKRIARTNHCEMRVRHRLTRLPKEQRAPLRDRTWRSVRASRSGPRKRAA